MHRRPGCVPQGGARHDGVMPIPPGDYQLGPDNAALLLHTGTEGPAAAMGHNLSIEATQWSADLTVGDALSECALSVTANLTSLVVIDGQGGAKPLTDGDRGKILQNAAKILQTGDHPQVVFTSTGISGDWTEGTVHGTLSLHGRTEPLDLHLDSPEPGCYRLAGAIAQHLFGIQPYSALMGTLKLADEIGIEVTIPFE